jgi:hypothetical protein
MALWSGQQVLRESVRRAAESASRAVLVQGATQFLMKWVLEAVPALYSCPRGAVNAELEVSQSPASSFLLYVLCNNTMNYLKHVCRQ